ncbi:hypothetical protein LRS06_18580 [Hymenobacter sp. J193]|uniref:hypothetical protein n=1 Tax=Hymenobacter sp. J193 TaxID=2898429 RepID=UPI002151DFD8|nr:hypothetical protein [Hymenobacter sp. J193]MCR5889739.1 hypothetical protein [Hymenobacter sp. J193]
MKSILLIYGLVYLLSVSPTYMVDNDKICWQENVILTVNDFQSLYPPVPEYVFKAQAWSKCSITVIRRSKKDGNDFCDVRVYFIKSKSWFEISKTDSRINNEVLAHEQLHFDIEELVGRKIRKCADDYYKINTKYSLELNSQIDCIFQERRALHSLYDEETDHGAIENKQIKWKEIIKSELDNLNDYKSTPKDCAM